MYVMVVSLGFCGSPNSGSQGSLTPLPAPGTLSLLLGCLLQPCCEGLCLVLVHLMPSSVDIPGRNLGERGGGRELRGVKGGKIAIKRYCIREE